MANSQRHPNSLRLISGLTLMLYLFTQGVCPPGYASSRSSATSSLQSLENALKTLPVSLGSVSELWLSPQSDKPFVLFVQDAHGQMEAQKNMQRLLKFIDQRVPLKTFLIEGGAGPLNPEKLRLFKASSLNRAAAKWFLREGDLGGIELFLLEKMGITHSLLSARARREKSSISVTGAEDRKLYLENLHLFEAVASLKPATDAWLSQELFKIEKEASKNFNPELLRFFKAWQAFETRSDQLESYLAVLEEAASKKAGIRLSDAASQQSWPMLVRFSELKRRQTRISYEEASRDAGRLHQWAELAGPGHEPFLNQLKNISKKNVSLGSVDLRGQWEAFYAKAKPLGFNFERYPALSLWEGARILESEMDVRLLMTEASRLRDWILTSLALQPQERRVIEDYRRHLLFEKLLKLNLERADFSKVKSRVNKSLISPSLQVSSQPATSSASPVTSPVVPEQAGIHAQDSLQKPVEIPGDILSPEMSKAFGLAIQFYKKCIARERRMGEMLLASKDNQRVKVFVSGGFHTEPLVQKIRAAGYSYAVLAPHMSQVENEKRYWNSMVGSKPLFAPPVLKAVPLAHRPPISFIRTANLFGDWQTTDLSGRLQDRRAGMFVRIRQAGLRAGAVLIRHPNINLLARSEALIDPRTGRSEVRIDSYESKHAGDPRTGRSEVRIDSYESKHAGDPRTGRSEVRAVATPLDVLLTHAEVTSSDTLFMELLPLMREGKPIPSDKERLALRRARTHGDVSIATVSYEVSGKKIKKSISPVSHSDFANTDITPIIRKTGEGTDGKGEYSLGLEVTSKATGEKFIMVSYVLVKDGNLRVGKLDKSNLEFNGRLTHDQIPSTTSPVMKEIINGIVNNRVPEKLRRLDIEQMRVLGLLTGNEGAVYFWGPSVRMDIPNNLPTQDFFLRIDPVEMPSGKVDETETVWTASLWINEDKDADGNVVRPALPIKDLILYRPSTGFTVERPYPSAGIGYRHVQGSVPDVKRTFKDLVKSHWNIYWLANGGTHPPDDTITARSVHGIHTDEYLFNLEGKTVQVPLSADFSKGETSRSWVTFTNGARGLKYKNSVSGAELYFVVFQNNHFQIPELVQITELSVDEGRAGLPVTGEERRDGNETVMAADIHEDFHPALSVEEKLLLIKERRQIWDEMEELEKQWQQLERFVVPERAEELERIRRQYEGLLTAAQDIASVQTQADYAGREYLKERLHFSRKPGFDGYEKRSDLESVRLFNELGAAVLNGTANSETFKQLQRDFGLLSTGGRKVLRVIELPVHERGKSGNKRIYPVTEGVEFQVPGAAKQNPWITLGVYPKDKVYASVIVEQKLGKQVLRLRLYDPDHLDELWDSFYYDEAHRRFVSSKDEWEAFFDNPQNLEAPGDMIAVPIVETGGRLNLFRGVQREITPGYEKTALGYIDLGDAVYDGAVQENFLPFRAKGAGRFYYLKVKVKNGQKWLHVYGSPNLSEASEIGVFRWLGDDDEWKGLPKSGSGFSGVLSGPLGEYKGYGYDDRVWTALREWVAETAQGALFHEIAHRDRIGTRNKVDLPMPVGLDKANPTHLSIRQGHGDKGQDVFWRTVTEEPGQRALDLYDRHGHFEERAFYSSESPEGLNAVMEASRRFLQLRETVIAGRLDLPPPILFSRPGSAKMGRYDLPDRGRTGAGRKSTNVIFNVFKDSGVAGLPADFQSDFLWSEYGVVEENGLLRPAMYATAVDFQNKRAFLAVRVVQTGEDQYRYDIYKEGQDVSAVVIPKLRAHGYDRALDSVVYPAYLEQRLQLVRREAEIAARPHEGLENMRHFSNEGILANLLEATRFSLTGRNWAEIYFFLADENFRTSLMEKARQALAIYHERSSDQDFLQSDEVFGFIRAYAEMLPALHSFSPQESWRFQALADLSQEISNLHQRQAGNYPTADIASMVHRLVVDILTLKTHIPVQPAMRAAAAGPAFVRPSQKAGVTTPTERLSVEWVPIPEMRAATSPLISRVVPVPAVSGSAPLHDRRPAGSVPASTPLPPKPVELEPQPVFHRGEVVIQAWPEGLNVVDRQLFITVTSEPRYAERVKLLQGLKSDYEELQIDPLKTVSKPQALPVPDLAQMWSDYRTDLARKNRPLPVLIHNRPSGYVWQEISKLPRAQRPFYQKLRESVAELQRAHPAIEYFWLEMAPAPALSGERRAAFYVTGVDFKSGQISPILRVFEKEKDRFVSAISPDQKMDAFAHPVFGMILEGGYKRYGEEIKTQSLLERRLTLIDQMLKIEETPWDEPGALTELLALENFTQSLVGARLASGAASLSSFVNLKKFTPGPSLLETYFVPQTRSFLKALSWAQKIANGDEPPTAQEALAFLESLNQTHEITDLLGYQTFILIPLQSVAFTLRGDAENLKARQQAKDIAIFLDKWRQIQFFSVVLPEIKVTDSMEESTEEIEEQISPPIVEDMPTPVTETVIANESAASVPAVLAETPATDVSADELLAELSAEELVVQNTKRALRIFEERRQSWFTTLDDGKAADITGEIIAVVELLPVGEEEMSVLTQDLQFDVYLATSQLEILMDAGVRAGEADILRAEVLLQHLEDAERHQAFEVWKKDYDTRLQRKTQLQEQGKKEEKRLALEAAEKQILEADTLEAISQGIDALREAGAASFIVEKTNFYLSVMRDIVNLWEEISDDTNILFGKYKGRLPEITRRIRSFERTYHAESMGKVLRNVLQRTESLFNETRWSQEMERLEWDIRKRRLNRAGAEERLSRIISQKAEALTQGRLLEDASEPLDKRIFELHSQMASLRSEVREPFTAAQVEAILTPRVEAIAKMNAAEVFERGVMTRGSVFTAESGFKAERVLIMPYEVYRRNPLMGADALDFAETLIEQRIPQDDLRVSFYNLTEHHFAQKRYIHSGPHDSTWLIPMLRVKGLVDGQGKVLDYMASTLPLMHPFMKGHSLVPVNSATFPRSMRAEAALKPYESGQYVKNGWLIQDEGSDKVRLTAEKPADPYAERVAVLPVPSKVDFLTSLKPDTKSGGYVMTHNGIHSDRDRVSVVHDWVKSVWQGDRLIETAGYRVLMTIFFNSGPRAIEAQRYLNRQKRAGLLETLLAAQAAGELPPALSLEIAQTGIEPGDLQAIHDTFASTFYPVMELSRNSLVIEGAGEVLNRVSAAAAEYRSGRFEILPEATQPKPALRQLGSERPYMSSRDEPGTGRLLTLPRRRGNDSNKTERAATPVFLNLNPPSLGHVVPELFVILPRNEKGEVLVHLETWDKTNKSRQRWQPDPETGALAVEIAWKRHFFLVDAETGTEAEILFNDALRPNEGSIQLSLNAEPGTLFEPVDVYATKMVQGVEGNEAFAKKTMPERMDSLTEQYERLRKETAERGSYEEALRPITRVILAHLLLYPRGTVMAKSLVAQMSSWLGQQSVIDMIEEAEPAVKFAPVKSVSVESAPGESTSVVSDIEAARGSTQDQRDPLAIEPEWVGLQWELARLHSVQMTGVSTQTPRGLFILDGAQEGFVPEQTLPFGLEEYALQRPGALEVYRIAGEVEVKGEPLPVYAMDYSPSAAWQTLAALADPENTAVEVTITGLVVKKGKTGRADSLHGFYVDYKGLKGFVPFSAKPKDAHFGARDLKRAQSLIGRSFNVHFKHFGKKGTNPVFYISKPAKKKDRAAIENAAVGDAFEMRITQVDYPNGDADYEASGLFAEWNGVQVFIPHRQLPLEVRQSISSWVGKLVVAYAYEPERQVYSLLMPGKIKDSVRRQFPFLMDGQAEMLHVRALTHRRRADGSYEMRGLRVTWGPGNIYEGYVPLDSIPFMRVAEHTEENLKALVGQDFIGNFVAVMRGGAGFWLEPPPSQTVAMGRLRSNLMLFAANAFARESEAQSDEVDSSAVMKRSRNAGDDFAVLDRRVHESIDILEQKGKVVFLKSMNRFLTSLMSRPHSPSAMQILRGYHERIERAIQGLRERTEILEELGREQILEMTVPEKYILRIMMGGEPVDIEVSVSATTAVGDHGFQDAQLIFNTGASLIVNPRKDWLEDRNPFVWPSGQVSHERLLAEFNQGTSQGSYQARVPVSRGLKIVVHDVFSADEMVLSVDEVLRHGRLRLALNQKDFESRQGQWQVLSPGLDARSEVRASRHAKKSKSGKSRAVHKAAQKDQDAKLFILRFVIPTAVFGGFLFDWLVLGVSPVDPEIPQWKLYRTYILTAVGIGLLAIVPMSIPFWVGQWRKTKQQWLQQKQWMRARAERHQVQLEEKRRQKEARQSAQQKRDGVPESKVPADETLAAGSTSEPPVIETPAEQAANDFLLGLRTKLNAYVSLARRKGASRNVEPILNEFNREAEKLLQAIEQELSLSETERANFRKTIAGELQNVRVKIEAKLAELKAQENEIYAEKRDKAIAKLLRDLAPRTDAAVQYAGDLLAQDPEKDFPLEEALRFFETRVQQEKDNLTVKLTQMDSEALEREIEMIRKSLRGALEADKKVVDAVKEAKRLREAAAAEAVRAFEAAKQAIVDHLWERIVQGRNQSKFGDEADVRAFAESWIIDEMVQAKQAEQNFLTGDHRFVDFQHAWRSHVNSQDPQYVLEQEVNQLVLRLGDNEAEPIQAVVSEATEFVRAKPSLKPSQTKRIQTAVRKQMTPAVQKLADALKKEFLGESPAAEDLKARIQSIETLLDESVFQDWTELAEIKGRIRNLDQQIKDHDAAVFLAGRVAAELAALTEVSLEDTDGIEAVLSSSLLLQENPNLTPKQAQTLRQTRESLFDRWAADASSGLNTALTELENESRSHDTIPELERARHVRAVEEFTHRSDELKIWIEEFETVLTVLGWLREVDAFVPNLTIRDTEKYGALLKQAAEFVAIPAVWSEKVKTRRDAIIETASSRFAESVVGVKEGEALERAAEVLKHLHALGTYRPEGEIREYFAESFALAAGLMKTAQEASTRDAVEHAKLLGQYLENPTPSDLAARFFLEEPSFQEIINQSRVVRRFLEQVSRKETPSNLEAIQNYLGIDNKGIKITEKQAPADRVVDPTNRRFISALAKMTAAMRSEVREKEKTHDTIQVLTGRSEVRKSEGVWRLGFSGGAEAQGPPSRPTIHDPRSTGVLVAVARSMTAKIVRISDLSPEILAQLFPPALKQPEAKLPALERQRILSFYTALFRRGGAIMMPAVLWQNTPTEVQRDYLDLLIEALETAEVSPREPMIHIVGDQNNVLKNIFFSSENWRDGDSPAGADVSRAVKFWRESEEVVAARLDKQKTRFAAAVTNPTTVLRSRAFVVKPADIRKLTRIQHVIFQARLTQLLQAASALNEEEFVQLARVLGLNYQIGEAIALTPSAILSSVFAERMNAIALAKSA